MLRIAFIVISLFFVVVSSAQEKNTIVCQAPAFKNQRAILYTYSDYFTSKLVELDIQQIDNNGKCTFSVDPKRGFKSFIQIQDKRGTIYIDPNTKNTPFIFQMNWTLP